MGMTDDFEVAIEEGATIVRVGRAVFGERSDREKGMQNEETWIHRRRQHGRGARARPHPAQDFQAGRHDRVRRRARTPAQTRSHAQGRDHRRQPRSRARVPRGPARGQAADHRRRHVGARGCRWRRRTQGQALHLDCRRYHDRSPDARLGQARASDPRDAECARDGRSRDGGDGACAKRHASRRDVSR